MGCAVATVACQSPIWESCVVAIDPCDEDAYDACGSVYVAEAGACPRVPPGPAADFQACAD